ncbi:hypothetical protein [Lacipirellula parvula]|uniref:Uncharacterized protein n=1 Tax=Lacipirellula parvula TaxID=2650471 RepID=A0A5K7X7A8_9BACT|nr:hypothetical protein [Lacipirellula parvula]BBO31727.1 hypothetical protein PLANPX_1339 [Lacipirellula parvula]
MSDLKGGGELGSLAQAARGSHLKSARSILIAVGILTIVVNIGLGIFAKNLVDSEIEKELRNASAQGMQVDPVVLEEFRSSAIRSVWVSAVLWSLTGVVFIGLGIAVYKYPVPATVAGLVLYIGCFAVGVMLDPASIAKGIIIKVIIVAGLFKAMKAAIESEKEQPASGLDALPASG